MSSSFEQRAAREAAKTTLCFDCPGKPDFQVRTILEYHRGQQHQQQTETTDIWKNEVIMHRSDEDGRFRCPTCDVGCDIANKIRPHVNECSAPPGSRSDKIIPTYDYSMTPDAPNRRYPLRGGYHPNSSSYVYAPSSPSRRVEPSPERDLEPMQQPRPIANRPHDDDPSARERFDTFLRRQRQDNAIRVQTDEKQPVQPQKFGSGRNRDFSTFKKKAVPPAPAPAPHPSPAAGPSTDHQLHASVSSVASSSGSYPRQAQSWSPSPQPHPIQPAPQRVNTGPPPFSTAIAGSTSARLPAASRPRFVQPYGSGRRNELQPPPHPSSLNISAPLLSPSSSMMEASKSPSKRAAPDSPGPDPLRSPPRQPKHDVPGDVRQDSGPLPVPLIDRLSSPSAVSPRLFSRAVASASASRGDPAPDPVPILLGRSLLERLGPPVPESPMGGSGLEEEGGGGPIWRGPGGWR